MPDLDFLESGMITDMIIEHANDGEEYDFVATQDDFDRF